MSSLIPVHFQSEKRKENNFTHRAGVPQSIFSQQKGKQTISIIELLPYTISGQQTGT